MAFGFDGLEVVLFVEFLLDFVDGIDDGENDGPDLIRNFDTEVTVSDSVRLEVDKLIVMEMQMALGSSGKIIFFEQVSGFSFQPESFVDRIECKQWMWMFIISQNVNLILVLDLIL